MTNERSVRIIEEFEKYFFRFGFKKTSIDDVSRQLKISKKTIYEHFSDKQSIFDTVIQKIADEFKAKIQRRLSSSNTEQERLTSLVKLIYSQGRNWLKKAESTEFRFKLEMSEVALREAYRQLIGSILAAGQQSGEFKLADAAIASRLLFSMVQEGLEICYADPALNIEDDILHYFKKMVL